MSKFVFSKIYLSVLIDAAICTIYVILVNYRLHAHLHTNINIVEETHALIISSSNDVIFEVNCSTLFQSLLTCFRLFFIETSRFTISIIVNFCAPLSWTRQDYFFIGEIQFDTPTHTLSTNHTIHIHAYTYKRQTCVR